ncbi:exodeoxyribonuclease VII small subunit [Anaeromicropila herbilytica]|uniref:Exodeoxyribonuclease 7 small subunit n=1 Tax=Anaeromicropila herbilytica TaxID=2785025 RepID=A0A7R7EKF5_9FIRM|nr:exodeoxyribonuclease VII small subunit [Anaeromicropila herbilytica]BCN30402.1 hypothetical protein bsdtb5_16970 [Anaeromicropila herbilytica]
MANKAKSLETSIEELNDILIKLESEDITLDQSFQLYNDGMKLLKHCNDSIDKIEKKIIILNENGDSNEL